MATVVIVDDEAPVRFALEEALATAGHAPRSFASVDDALPHLAEADVVLTDLVMPGRDGWSLLAQVRRDDPELPVVLLTARGSERIAADAIKAGAWDYLAKPFSVHELRAVIARAAEARALRRAASEAALARTVGVELVGEAPAWRACVQAARRLARRDVAVLITGETGTGKELVASLIHAESPRAARPLVRFNCAAIAAELAEAELFGHARGAFTGAIADRPGFIAQADGGTLILDEVGELPLAVQAKLLRTLQEGEIQPVGAGRVRKVDVRVVACTHRDLQRDVVDGRFRADLYYRLAVVTVRVPPLRERRGDLPALIRAFCRKWARRFDMPDVHLAPAVLDALAAADYPGNVRELDNRVAGLLAMSDGGEISEVNLGAVASPSAGAAPPLRARVEAFERAILEEALRASGGNQAEAARQLGLTRSTLLDKLKRHGLHPTSKG